MGPRPFGVHLLVRMLIGLVLGLAVLFTAIACNFKPPPAAPTIAAPEPGASSQSSAPAAPAQPGGPGGVSGNGSQEGEPAPSSETASAPIKQPPAGSAPHSTQTNQPTETSGSSPASQPTVTPLPSPNTQPDPAAVAEARRAALRNGEIVYHAPSPMRQGQVQRIAVNASGIADKSEAEASLSPAPGALSEHSIPVGVLLVADLKGDGFEVTPLNGANPARTSLPGEISEWQWDIKATKVGPRTLTVIVYSYYGGDTNGPPDAVRYINEPVNVERDWGYTLNSTFSSPLWTATGITIPVLLAGVGGTWAFLRKRRKKPVEPAASEPPDKSDQSTAGYM